MNDLIILAALLRQPAYGYALKKTAGLIFGNRSLHSNVVYPSLNKFVRNRWVEQSTAPGERGQKRKQYRITAAGRKYVIGQLASLSGLDTDEASGFLFRLAFFDVLSPCDRQAIIEARAASLEARIERLAGLHPMTKPDSFAGVALARVRATVDDELQWIRKLQRKLKLTAAE